MINALNGKLVKVNPHDLVINVGGMEFFLEVSTNASAFFSTMLNESEVRVLAVLVVREDAMLLFGFKDEAERECFNQLQTVPGIGAKQALKILSSISVKDLIFALDQRDVSRLSKIPGIGPKSAQKLILQLRDTLVYTDDSPSGVDNLGKEDKIWNDLIDALSGMGFDRKAVLRALEETTRGEAEKLKTMDHNDAESYIFPILLRRLSK